MIQAEPVDQQPARRILNVEDYLSSTFDVRCSLFNIRPLPLQHGV